MTMTPCLLHWHMKCDTNSWDRDKKTLIQNTCYRGVRSGVLSIKRCKRVSVSEYDV